MAAESGSGEEVLDQETAGESSTIRLDPQVSLRLMIATFPGRWSAPAIGLVKCVRRPMTVDECELALNEADKALEGALFLTG